MTLRPSASRRAPNGNRELTRSLEVVGRAAGLDAVGVAPARRFAATRVHLRQRKAAGLHAGMAFTYRNPERSTDPGRIVPGARSLVVGARCYRRADPAPRPGAVPGRVARYAWVDEYAPLRAALDVVAERLRADGFKARVVVDDNALVDREAAVRAGLGWYGKNANVLLPGRGSWFVLGSVVTDAALPVSRRVTDGCGACARCLSGCPTGAIIAPGVVDARRCLAWLVQAPGAFPFQYREALDDRMYGCDDCQEVCPHNRSSGDPGPEPPRGARPWVDVLTLLSLGDDDLLEAAGAWYVAERDPRHLRRNALIVLGNAGDRRDPRVIEALDAALRHADPLVRGHAVWASARLGRPDLADGLLPDEDDPGVRSELERRAEVMPNRWAGDGGAVASPGR